MTGLSADAAMGIALQLAKRGLGNTAENPAVGCVIVKDGKLVGRGYTQAGGRPHAETMALAQAGKLAEGAEVFVTLEPCSHHGKTPPCAKALIEAKVAKVYVALRDPNPEVQNQGIAMLEKAGIAVEQDLRLSEALFLNQGYIMRRTLRRPLIVAKLATSKDGAMALANGKSQWITSSESRKTSHGFRASFDALLTGIGTVLSDNPSLTCRLPGLENQLPLRVVLDSQLRIPVESTLVQQAQKHPLCVYCTLGLENSPQAEELVARGIRVQGIATEEHFRGLRLWDILHDLADQGINRIMLEAGPALSSSFLRARLIDRMVWFKGPCLLGEDSIPAIGGLGLEELQHSPKLFPLHVEQIEDDQLEVSIVDYS